MITNISKKILVADDSEFFRIKLSNILTEAGHKIMVVNDGMEVINELQINPNGPDILILDIQMPNVDGFEVLEWINEHGMNGNFPVLVITGAYEATRVIKRLKKLEAKGLMTKAHSPEQIVYRVNQLLFPERTHRKAPRVPVSIPADYTIGETSSKGYILNVGGAGLFLHTKNEIDPGSVLTLKFSIPETQELLNLRGIVKWCAHTSGKKNLFGGAGIEFIFRDDRMKELVREFVEAELKRLEQN